MAESLFGLPPERASERIVALGGKPFHARIVRREVLERGVLDYGEMSSLPKDLRRSLAEELPILAGREVTRTVASDGATKLLIEFDAPEGTGGPLARVETVHIPPRRSGTGRGATVCVSTQAGCPVGCPFCASGIAGLTRNLAAHEILEQFLRARQIGDLSRAVVMGIGEPLLNATALRDALDVVHDELGMGARKVTVSTVGFPERVRRLADTRPPFQLAISLHTGDDRLRDELVPVMAGTPIEEVLEAGDEWFRVTGREVTYEVALLRGVNDGPGSAELIADRLRGRRCTVNLIPYNPSEGLPYQRPRAEDVEKFRGLLEERGLVATVRWSRGLDGSAACGQLRLQTG